MKHRPGKGFFPGFFESFERGSPATKLASVPLLSAMCAGRDAAIPFLADHAAAHGFLSDRLRRTDGRLRLGRDAARRCGITAVFGSFVGFLDESGGIDTVLRDRTRWLGNTRPHRAAVGGDCRSRKTPKAVEGQADDIRWANLRFLSESFPKLPTDCDKQFTRALL